MLGRVGRFNIAGDSVRASGFIVLQEVSPAVVAFEELLQEAMHSLHHPGAAFMVKRNLSCNSKAPTYWGLLGNKGM